MIIQFIQHMMILLLVSVVIVAIFASFEEEPFCPHGHVCQSCEFYKGRGGDCEGCEPIMCPAIRGDQDE